MVRDELHKFEIIRNHKITKQTCIYRALVKNICTSVVVYAVGMRIFKAMLSCIPDIVLMPRISEKRLKELRHEMREKTTEGTTRTDST